MTQVKFYDSVDDSLLKFAVIVAKSNGNWVFCKHKERDTYECPGGHREAGEAIDDTAKRELYEETGAIDYVIQPVCIYSVTAPDNFDGKETFGKLYYAQIKSFEGELHSEIEKVELFDELPTNWTYPEIQPLLLKEVENKMGEERHTVTVNNNSYKIIKLLGKGKGGYSYLAESDGKQFVLKQIHHEPCDYYTFGNKIEAERNDYQRLLNAGIRIPKMLDIDIENERIIKEYTKGDTIFDMVKNDVSVEEYLTQVREMATLAKSSGLNIDYFPTNFVVQNGLLYYIDYECNNYMDKWNFENWGIKYWSRTPEFLEYVSQHS